MQTRFGQTPENLPTQAMPQVRTQNGSATTTKEIPYDYVARFTLNGQLPGNRVQEVINISVEGAFVAVAIGYSFVPTVRPLADLAPPDRLANSGIPATTLQLFAECMLVRLCGIDFLYSIIDSSTGRELQNRPIHNIAGLGEANGIRPFRPMAKPMLFQPRSTIRIEIEELSVGPQYVNAQLFIVLHGYKILGYGTGLP
jgi:hypothetical protein